MSYEIAGSEGPRGQHQDSTRHLWLFGLAGPIVFWVVIGVLYYLDPSDPISDPISWLGHVDAQHPYVLRANFMIWGVSILAFTLGVARRFQDGWRLKIALILFVLLGVTQAGHGVFPASPDPIIDMGHAIVGILSLISLLIGIPLLSWQFHMDDRYPGYRSRWTVIAIPVLIVGTTAIFLYPKLFPGALTGFDGLIVIPITGVLTGWVAYHSFRLYQVTTEQ